MVSSYLDCVVIVLTYETVFTLFTGRLIQAVASTILWVVGFATIADSSDASDTGKVYGFVTVAINLGTSCGPLVAGVLFDLAGYWAAWSSVLVVVITDVVLRCLMIENKQRNLSTLQATKSDHQDTEREALLPSLPEVHGGIHELESEKTELEIYTCLFSNGRFTGGIICYLCFAILTMSFDTTLPLHVRGTFQWGSLQSGLLFAAFQGPGVFLSVPVGWLKDRVGTRWPTTIGFALLVPLVLVVGMPGDERFPWANQGDVGRIIYSAMVGGTGVVICLLNGVGMIEATRKFQGLQHCPPDSDNNHFAEAVDEIQGEKPGIFGRNGGYSRAISITSMSFTLGMFVGPIVAGYGTEQIGYFGMNCLMGMFIPC